MSKFDFEYLRVKSGENEDEVIILKPRGKGPFPSVVFIHGHNFTGAWQDMMIAYFLASAGYVAILPSQIGYGLTQGSPDFIGPKTVNLLKKCIDKALTKEYVNKNKLGLWGISRGAIACSLLATQYPEMFKAVVLQSGVYDMKKDFEWEDKMEGIKENMLIETEGLNKNWKERSAIYDMEKLMAPVLILHGEKDDRVNVEQAKLLDQKLDELGKEHKTVIIEDAQHLITKITRKKYTFPFFEKYLKS